MFLRDISEDGYEADRSAKAQKDHALSIQKDLDDLRLGERSGGDQDHRGEVRLWLRLLACSTLIEAELRRQFRENFDFTLPRFDILAQLDREPGGLVQGELSKRLMVSQANVTPIIERLIADGFVTRSPSNLDRRIQIICLTIEGRQKFRRMAKKHNAWLADAMAGFPEEEIEEIGKKLALLKRALIANRSDPQR
ncbi:DNA-binding transcriptional regulator, MarR family [Bosea sp. 62]|uniref:MarR family winged helix-turn-helix transcriptional regulator n=1 Tax=unclassified Bosea (in: a-proteobacteria) TaxID=2653178 RepID=UPI00125B0E81|nr:MULTISPECIES: MarR family transcriptional regulator [unclassified Bosea (in: a-proteobacteria)]CAD5256662.1 DNA-binding transcriptional regulator, MarR family [Bosea sp. 46]CAD5260990.1 DNA-binding transcriptional regulator, MarR family [Bosea sp. 21B]CAD5279645.1 DNA-binding transcriptional regulator, MarR family [Bosea sp. 7B]VVT58375.1 DNA-binding transcriptional regulator, MarR family [Bosea sp. EC-HK365B]VXB52354.1 DNA-binding transcriptional regulator, MarR family [Bosea sp. 29B]